MTSGLASNPLIGNTCDRLVDQGGTAVLSETTEFIGAEHILARRGGRRKSGTGFTTLCTGMRTRSSWWARIPGWAIPLPAIRPAA